MVSYGIELVLSLLHVFSIKHSQPSMSSHHALPWSINPSENLQYISLIRCRIFCMCSQLSILNPALHSSPHSKWTKGHSPQQAREFITIAQYVHTIQICEPACCPLYDHSGLHITTISGLSNHQEVLLSAAQYDYMVSGYHEDARVARIN